MKTTNNIAETYNRSFPDFVAYWIVDAFGRLVAMEEDGEATEKILAEGGLNIDGSSIKGLGCGVEKSDLRLIPEPESFLSVKLDKTSGDSSGESLLEHHRFLAHLEDENGDPHPRDPRGILHRMVQKAHDKGFEPFMFSEIEFYILKSDGTPADTAGYCSLPPEDKSYAFRHELGNICKHQLGIPVKRIHHECGPGQNEMELQLTPCMKNADDTVLATWIMQLLAARRNQRIVFSPKPFGDQAGNGMHHHILLRDLHTGENVFVDRSPDETSTNGSSEAKKLSKTCQSGIAGLLKYADDITAVFAASRETFDRLRPGFEAPIFKTWGFSNRSCLVRVPETTEDVTRFEYRGGDLSGSVHLFGAVLLAAVLKGIDDKLELQEPVDCNVEQLAEKERRDKNILPVPLRFDKCIEVLKTSTFLREALGFEMVEFLIERDLELSRAAD